MLRHNYIGTVDAPVNFTCRNWVTEVYEHAQNELASIMPNHTYYEISAV
jgi:hypothetical protein